MAKEKKESNRREDRLSIDKIHADIEKQQNDFMDMLLPN